MKKLGYVVAALGVLAIAAPTIASAETTIIKKRDHGGPFGARAEFREHRDFKWRHPHTGKVVIIKRGHRHYD